jgi:hypothetical protein
LHEKDKPITSEDYDRIACAEIPDKSKHPLLFVTVEKCMMHGPCGPMFPGAPCMIDGMCSKSFPKSFAEKTSASLNGYV